MGAGDLKRKLQAASASERHAMVKKNKQACASEGSKILKTKKLAYASQGSQILKAKKEAMDALSLLRFKHVPGGSEMWTDEWREMKAKAAEEEARPARKRKRVLKKRLPKALIDLMVAWPFGSNDLTPAQLAKFSTGFRKIYPISAFVNAKLHDYEQALIRQYNAQGYAEEEVEVTDSEDEEEDATAVEDQ